jgi:hypothetical protein
MARAFLSQVSRDAVAALDGVPEPEIQALLAGLRELPAVHPSMRVQLPAEIDPALERLTDAYATGDPNTAWAPLDAILEEIDTPIERARLVRVVLALHEEGLLDERGAAVTALELGGGSRVLLRECLTEAVAEWVSEAYVRRGLPAALSAASTERDAAR